MSEPIIIETPQPPTRERLVCVPEGAVVSRDAQHGTPYRDAPSKSRLFVEPGTEVRDAEPEDIDRAGYVTRDHARRVADMATDIAGHAALDLRDDLREAIARAEKAERERDEARAALAKWQGSAEQERARCVTIVRATAEKRRGDVSGEITAGVLNALADRLERGEHAGAPVPKPLPRATDEELADLFVEVFRTSPDVDIAKARLAAVAARVRREACLVTRAVEAGALFSIRPYVCKWIVIASHGGNDRRETVPAADVPKTLARLLGEVTR